MRPDGKGAALNRLWLYLIAAAGLAVVGRAVGPSDLYDNDQPKTVAYTVDMVENDRWLAPVDMLGRPTTKPPLYNWIGAPFYAVLGPGEFVLKLPSVIGGLVVIGITVWMGRWLGERGRISRPAAENRVIPCLDLGIVAGLLWLASPMGIKHIYLARPDMVLAAALTGGWACATVCLRSESRCLGYQIGLWLCVSLAALAKGPPAVLVILFVFLGAKPLTDRLSAVHRTGWWWGLPLALALVALWAWAAYAADPAGFRQGMLGDTVEHHSTVGGFGSTLLGIATDLWQMPAQFIARFLPWSIFVVLTLIHIAPRRWFASAYGPAVLWVLVVIGLFMLSPRQRPDYLLPAFGPAAILAAYWLLVVGAKYRLTGPRVAVAALAVLVGLCVYYWRFDDAATTGYGRNTARFAAAVRQVAGDAPIEFVETGYNPLQSLVGRNHPQPPDPIWRVTPLLHAEADAVPILVSRPIPGVGAGAGAMGLYPVNPDNRR